MLAGLALGLGLAEAGFHLRDRGAFPHLNLYESDARLGVRLRPGSAQRLLFGKNPLTSVRINRDGLRGPDLPPPTAGEIVVVGDSQVFGLGVEEHETASAVLGRMLGSTAVINAGVPTYGPAEYNAVVSDMLARRRVGTVVYVVNLVNDLFEASHPNTERHRVWDGWAVRTETAPDTVTRFPGRELVYRRSHLFYALRTYLHARGPQLDDRGFASEGTATELLVIGTNAGNEHARADRETMALKAKRDQEIQSAAAKHLAADLRLEDLVIDTFLLRNTGGQAEAYRKSRDNPGDIVVNYTTAAGVESERPLRVTATTLYNGAQIRRAMEARIKVFAELAARVDAGEGHGRLDLPEPWAKAGYSDIFSYSPYLDSDLKQGLSHPIVRTLEERQALQKRLDELRAAPAEIVRAWSPLTPHLRAVKAACDAHGARLLVVALPMDVQVSPTEWTKYGAPPIDMEPTRILLEDIVTSAEAIGALGLDATPALAAAEPGAFLDGDIHMTPKGQKALAEAIAGKLASAAH
ncbi:hypothetical protein A7982_13656 [Minicystis rosea]|nr:hypothetical protein A7982_13656 [Minicystis rosea]